MYVDHDYQRHCATVIRQKGVQRQQQERQELEQLKAQWDRLGRKMVELCRTKGVDALGALVADLKDDLR